MGTKKGTTPARKVGNDGTAALLRQYGCGPVQLTAVDDALYERHLLFDHVVGVKDAGPRERFESFARSEKTNETKYPMTDTCASKILGKLRRGILHPVSFGYGHPRLLKTLQEQAARLAVTSRAFHSDRLPAFLARVCELTGLDRALPMSTGAEGVETAIKCVRKWAYTVKKVPADRAEIITCAANFRPSFSLRLEFADTP